MIGMTNIFKKNNCPKMLCSILLLIIFSLLIMPFCWADNAMVLPKGRWMTSVGVDFYPGWDKEFNNDGDTVSLAQDYSRELNTQVFPELAAVEALIPGFKASLGRSIVKIEKEAVITDVMISYGINNKVTIGLKVPYWHFKSKVQTELDNSPGAATIVKNPNFNPLSPIGPQNSPFIPDNPPDTDQYKITRDDILDILSNGLPEYGIEGYGYKRFESWSGDGLGDMELGLKYQYLTNKKWRLSVQSGVRLPTGRVDDPDNLVDYGFGGGNYDLIIGAQNDFLGFQNFVFNGTVRYTYQHPDEETIRILSSPDLPLSRVKKEVERDYGDIFEIEFSGLYRFSSEVCANVTYGGYFKAKDSIKVDGKLYAPLEAETRQKGHTILCDLTYSNLAQYQETTSGIPFQISVGYWFRFDGENLNKAEYTFIKTTFFF